MPPTRDPEIARRAEVLTRELGAVMAGQTAEISAAMHRRIAHLIQPLQVDEPVMDLLYASIESNIETLVHLTRYELPASEVAAPAAALGYARRLAQLDVSIAALLRAYRLGQQLVVDWALTELTRLEPDRDVVIEAGRQFAKLTFAYVDSVSEHLVEAHSAERERCLAHRSTVRAAVVEELIAGVRPNLQRSEAVLGLRLRQFHLAVVLWHDDPDVQVDGLDDLEHALGGLAADLGAGSPPLFVPRERGLAWGWLALGRSPSADHRALGLPSGAPPGLRVALGLPGAGPEGFRTSHLEALRAARVAGLAQGQAHAVTSYADSEVRAAAALASDLEMTRGMVERSLGPLAADSEPAEQLRETLRVFLFEKGSFVSTGERLHLHRNSVRYRVEKAIAERGRPVDEDRLELELALIACRWLGPAVLQTAGG